LAEIDSAGANREKKIIDNSDLPLISLLFVR